MVFVLTIAIDAGVRNKPKARLTGSYFRRTQPVRQAIIVGAPILALISSVASTYATPERPPLWHVTVFVAQIGSAIFPVVGKLATHIVPALPPVTLYKAQFVVTLFMLASLTLIITTISIVLFMSRSERRALREATERSGYRSRSPAIIWLTSPFLVGFGLALYFGWLGFTPEPKDMQGARCLVTAACYVQNDILLLAAALIDAGMSLIVWAGTFIMLRNSIDRGVS